MIDLENHGLVAVKTLRLTLEDDSAKTSMKVNQTIEMIKKGTGIWKNYTLTFRFEEVYDTDFKLQEKTYQLITIGKGFRELIEDALFEKEFYRIAEFPKSVPVKDWNR